jgi:hypothetical protein
LNYARASAKAAMSAVLAASGDAAGGIVISGDAGIRQASPMAASNACRSCVGIRRRRAVHRCFLRERKKKHHKNG